MDTVLLAYLTQYDLGVDDGRVRRVVYLGVDENVLTGHKAAVLEVERGRDRPQRAPAAMYGRLALKLYGGLGKTMGITRIILQCRNADHIQYQNINNITMIICCTVYEKRNMHYVYYITQRGEGRPGENQVILNATLQGC